MRNLLYRAPRQSHVNGATALKLYGCIGILLLLLLLLLLLSNEYYLHAVKQKSCKSMLQT